MVNRAEQCRRICRKCLRKSPKCLEWYVNSSPLFQVGLWMGTGVKDEGKFELIVI